MVAEPMLGVGGAIVPPKEYWPKVAEILRRHGVLLVMDEIFTGFERTGDRFAYFGYDIEPDIATFGKAIGGGLPIAGFIATDEIGAAFSPGDHSTTFGGKNMLGVSAGHAVLDILEQEDLGRKAVERGDRLIEGLQRLRERFPEVGDVRGKGLFVGLELVKDARGGPDAALAKKIVGEALREGVLIATTGAYGNVIRITPPLVISSEEIDRAVEGLTMVVERSLSPGRSAEPGPSE